MRLGADISTYLEELRHGAVFRRDGRVTDPLDELRKNGVDCVRLRLWNDPYSEDGKPYLAGTCDINNFIELAQLVTGKGFSVMLDFHYSDFWADPGKQFIPKAWRGLDAVGLERAVYDFTCDTLLRLNHEGISPAYIQVGNEITNGMLWPAGRLDESTRPRGNYDALCRLLDAGSLACREISPQSRLILHLERSHDKAVYREFLSETAARGVDYDILGVSYYPYWHGTMDQLFDNLNACRAFGKDIMIVETGYGFTFESYISGGGEARLVVDANRLSQLGLQMKYPLSPEGQAGFVRELLARAKSSGLAAVFWWEPLWLPGEGICWASEAGQDYICESGKSTANEWANQCLFDYSGNMLPAFDEFRLDVDEV